MKILLGFFSRFSPAIIIVFYVLLMVLGIHGHGMWRDEMQAWMIARYSHSIPDLLFNLRYESHPPLWYFILYFVKHFTSSPLSIQIVHITIASINCWLIIKFSPFSRIQNIFLVFGYFLFYEYALISRAYSLGVLFVLLFCIFASKPQRNYLYFSLILSLLALTSIMGLLLSVMFCLYLCFDHVLNRRESSNRALGLGLFVLTVFVSLHSMWPPPDGGYIKGLIENRGPWAFFDKLYQCYLPNVFNVFPRINEVFVKAVCILLFLISPFIFIRHKPLLFLYVLGVLGMILFFSMVNCDYPRHKGHVFLLLIACWWMAGNISGIMNQLLTFFLFFHFLLGIDAYNKEYTYKLSPGREAAQYIQANKLASLPIIGDSFEASTVAGYLGRAIFYPRENRWGTFVLYDNKRFPTQKKVISQARRISVSSQQDVLLVMTYPLKMQLEGSLKKIKFFNLGSRNENIYLYVLKRSETKRN